MKRTADSWYILQLAVGNSRALHLLDRVRRKKDEQLIIPTVTIVELRRLTSRRGTLTELLALLEKLETQPGVSFVSCDKEMAHLAGSLSSTYALPSIDALVAATAILTESHALLSGDSHFKPLRKQNILKIESW